MKQLSEEEFIEKLKADTIKLTEDIYIKDNSLYNKVFSGTKDNLLNEFDTVLEGNNHSIKNISKQLFNKISEDGVIKNLTLIISEEITDCCLTKLNDGLIENVTVKGEETINRLIRINDGEIRDCTIDIPIQSQNDETGGVTDINKNLVKECTVISSVCGTENVGGIVGKNNKGKIKECKSKAKIQGTESVGGVVGKNLGKIIDCEFFEAELFGDIDYGGICGLNESSMKRVVVRSCRIIQNDCSDGFVVGGICGRSRYGIIRNCKVKNSKIQAKKTIGGIIGRMYDSMLVKSNVMENVHVKGVKKVGGIVGKETLSILESIHSKGVVEGKRTVGGISGETSGSYTKIISKAVIRIPPAEDGTECGKIFGENKSSGVESCYYYGKDSEAELIGKNKSNIAQDINISDASESELKCIIGM